MGILGKKSFYESERNRISKAIEDPMLMLVLQYLPHLQLTQEEQDMTWGIIAVNLSNRVFIDAMKNRSTSEGPEANDTQVITGFFVKELFEKLYQPFCDKMYQHMKFGNGLDVFTTRSDNILHELFKLRNYDIEVLAKLGQERFEEKQRDKFRKMMDEKMFLMQSYMSNGEKDPAKVLDVGEDTKKILEDYKDSQEKLKLQVYEEELSKKHQRIERLMTENSQLLALLDTKLQANQPLKK